MNFVKWSMIDMPIVIIIECTTYIIEAKLTMHCLFELFCTNLQIEFSLTRETICSKLLVNAPYIS